MSFRRIPFQFSSTDPVQRQAELEKRFGLPGSGMYVDVANPLSTGSGNKEPNLTANSPRLQHRVPIFVEGRDQPIKSSVDTVISNSDCKKKSNVRVIPIEIEGAESRPATRHRTFSGPAGWAKVNDDESVPEREEGSPLKRSMQDLTEPSKIRATEGPVVHNIPIKIEGRSEPIKNFKSDKLNLSREDHCKLNRCAVSKQPTKIKSPEKEHKAESYFVISVKKIQNVLEELKLYDSDVQKFAGTMKNKQYRYLDEMLTRCMLRLDDIDTMGNEEVRSMRKNAVKKVQASIDLLEMKVNPDNKAVTVGFGNIAEMHNDGEEVISTDVKEMNSENTIMVDMTSENVEERNSQDQASEFEMTKGKEAESELQSCNSDVVSHVPSKNNLTTIARTEELPKESDLNEVEMVQFKSDECKANIVSTSEITEVKIDQRISDASEVPEVEMTEADNLSSSQNVDPEKINEICAVEMIESKLDGSESQTSNVNATLNEIAANEFVETIKNPKVSSELGNAGTMSKITDIEMEDIQTQSISDKKISFEKSDALIMKPVTEIEMSSSQVPSISNVPERNQRIGDCVKVINNPAVDTSESQPQLLSENALTKEVSENFVDPTVKVIINEVAELPSEIQNNSNDL